MSDAEKPRREIDVVQLTQAIEAIGSQNSTIRRVGLAGIALAAILIFGGTLYAAQNLRDAASEIAKERTRLSVLRTQQKELEASIEKLRAQRAALIKEKNDLAVATTVGSKVATNLVEEVKTALKDSNSQAAISKVNELSSTLNSVGNYPASVDKNEAPEAMNVLIQDLYSSDSAKRVRAAQQLVADYRTNPKLPDRLLDAALSKSDYPNGFYNTFVILDALDAKSLVPSIPKISQLMKTFEGKWPATTRLSKKVLAEVKAAQS